MIEDLIEESFPSLSKKPEDLSWEEVRRRL